MLYYFIVYPLLFFVGIVWPVLCSLNGLQKKDEKEIKTWLWDWVGYVVLAITMSTPGVLHLVHVPFVIFEALLFDIYYPTLLVGVVLLVNPINPKGRYLEVVVAKTEEYVAKAQANPKIKEQLERGQVELKKLVDQVMTKIGKAKAAATEKKD